MSQDKNITMKSNIKLNIRQLHELLSPDERNHNEVQHKVQHKIIAWFKTKNHNEIQCKVEHNTGSWIIESRCKQSQWSLT